GGSAPAVQSGGGDVTLNAAGGLFIGDPSGTGHSGNVLTAGSGSIVLGAGGNVNFDEGSLTAAQGTGGVSVTAGGNVSLLQTHAPGAQVATHGGAVSFTTGAGGVFTAGAGSPPNIRTTAAAGASGDV